MTLTDTIRFTTQLAKERAGTWYLGRLRGDPLCQLTLRDGSRHPQPLCWARTPATRDRWLWARALDPYPTYERIRALGPLSRSQAGPWLTTSYTLANQVLRDRAFTVRQTPYEQLEPGPLGHEEGTEWELSFLEVDPPDHTRLRRLAMPAFSPKMIAGYRAQIEKVTHRLLDDVVRRGEFDLMRDIAAPLPIAVITELLGIPEADTERFTRYGQVVGAALDGVRTPVQARALRRTTRDLNELFADLVRQRSAGSAEGGTDVISMLTTALDKDKLTPRELLGMCRLLLIAGFETTVNLIGNGMLALLRNPDQWELLRGDPGMAEQVVEETLRYDSPVQVTGRWASDDSELAGQSVRAGQQVVTLLGAAGRDPEVYPDPAQFDIKRETAVEHLAFSSGRHYCLGAPLARLEGVIAFQAIAERLPSLRSTGWVRRRRTMTIRGLTDFPLRLTAATR